MSALKTILGGPPRATKQELDAAQEEGAMSKEERELQNRALFPRRHRRKLLDARQKEAEKFCSPVTKIFTSCIEGLFSVFMINCSCISLKFFFVLLLFCCSAIEHGILGPFKCRGEKDGWARCINQL